MKAGGGGREEETSDVCLCVSSHLSSHIDITNSVDALPPPLSSSKTHMVACHEYHVVGLRGVEDRNDANRPVVATDVLATEKDVDCDFLVAEKTTNRRGKHLYGEVHFHCASGLLCVGV